MWQGIQEYRDYIETAGAFWFTPAVSCIYWLPADIPIAIRSGIVEIPIESPWFQTIIPFTA